MTNATTSGVKRRGFASLSPERRREIASMGGKQAHLEGRAHQFTSEEAAAAWRKGGQARAEKEARDKIAAEQREQEARKPRSRPPASGSREACPTPYPRLDRVSCESFASPSGQFAPNVVPIQRTVTEQFPQPTRRTL